jgi:hypothetical protein
VGVGDEFGDQAPTPPPVHSKTRGEFIMWPFNKDEMGEDARTYALTHCREGVEPRTAVEDFGDYDEDHDEEEHAAADGMIGKDKVQVFYKSCQNTNIEIL